MQERSTATCVTSTLQSRYRPEMMYERPANLDDALACLASGDRLILAGGTDVYPMLGDRPARQPVLDITALSDLRGVREEAEHWRIGALTTWTEILNADLPRSFDGLKLAAREVGSIQIQNRATVAGNLCNASPAADGVPPLLTLDAEIQLTSLSGSRRLPLASFITGYRAVALAPGELVTAILIPKTSTGGSSSFIKLGARKYLVISIAMVAARLELDQKGFVSSSAISVGACSAVAQRLTRLEQHLAGYEANRGFEGMVSPGFLADLSPISDVRATDRFRSDAAAVLIERTLDACVMDGASA